MPYHRFDGRYGHGLEFIRQRGGSQNIYLRAELVNVSDMIARGFPQSVIEQFPMGAVEVSVFLAASLPTAKTKPIFTGLIEPEVWLKVNKTDSGLGYDITRQLRLYA